MFIYNILSCYKNTNYTYMVSYSATKSTKKNFGLFMDTATTTTTQTSETPTSAIDWTSLPLDLLASIADLTVFPEGLLYFSMVCKSWQSAASVLPKISILKKVPMVMLPEEPEANRDIHGPKTRRFYSFATSETYTLELPEASGKKIVPTSYGWLVAVGYDLQINLLHPFSREQIRLPPLLTFKQQYEYNDDFKPEEVVSFFVNKVTLSKPPRTNKFFDKPSRPGEDFMAVAIYGEYRLLAFARAGDAEWTDIAVNSKVYEDVIYYNETFYTMDCHGLFFECDIENENGPKVVQRAPCPDGVLSGSQKYLVESSGNLLMVERFREFTLINGDYERSHTSKFTIFRLEECRQDQDVDSKYPYRWTQIENLDGRALFLGSNVSKSLPPSECVKPNCIYFTEFEMMFYVLEPDGGGHDTGIYDVEKQTVETHYAANYRCPLSPPMWYLY